MMKSKFSFIMSMFMVCSFAACTGSGEKELAAFYKETYVKGRKQFELFYGPGLTYRVPKCSCGDFEFRSLVLHHFKKGRVISFYAHHETDPDRVELTVKENIGEYRVNTLENPYEDRFIKLVRYGSLESDAIMNVIHMK